MWKTPCCILAAVLSLSAFPAAAEPPAAAAAPARAPSAAETVARAYMRAYSRADWDGMAALMSEDVVFADRTNPDPQFKASYEGRGAVLAMLRGFGAQSGVVELGFEFPMVFESHGVVVFAGKVNTLSAAPGATSGYRWRARQVIALTIRDGKVIRHEDFADYPRAVIEKTLLAEDRTACASGHQAIAPALRPLTPFLGDWTIASVQKQKGGPDMAATGRMRVHPTMAGRAIELESEHEDPFTPGSTPFIGNETWMVHPGSGQIVGMAINSLGNRKFHEGAFDNGDLLIVAHGEMFAGARQMERTRYHFAAPDRIELGIEISVDDGATWRRGGYTAVYRRAEPEGLGGCG